MNNDLGEPLGHQEIIRRINAQKAAEEQARRGGPQARPETPNSPRDRRARISAFRHESNGQFYAMSHEDRIAYTSHCEGILADLQPVNHRERWLANSIAEDQWRLNRARALESNIFAIGMSRTDINIDSAEGHAAICQAKTWLADGRQLQQLALYESRIRRSIEKNEKQLKELQAERKAAYDKALDEEMLLARLAIMEGETYSVAPEEDGRPDRPNGFGFSTEQILTRVRREMRIEDARRHQKQGWSANLKRPKAA
jgi:hypothetical protein